MVMVIRTCCDEQHRRAMEYLDNNGLHPANVDFWCQSFHSRNNLDEDQESSRLDRHRPRPEDTQEIARPSPPGQSPPRTIGSDTRRPRQLHTTNHVSLKKIVIS